MPVHCNSSPANAKNFARCTSRSLDLLQHIRRLLNDEILFSNVRCSGQQVEVNPTTETVSVCAPFLAQEYFSRMWEDQESFNNRKRLCEVTRGFYIRAITINRAIGYIASGDYRR
ncbi:unnamed protein product [Lota lota]